MTEFNCGDIGTEFMKDQQYNKVGWMSTKEFSYGG